MERAVGKTNMLSQPKAVWAVAFACVIAFMGIGLVDPILPAIAEKMNASQSQVTLLFTSYNLVMAVAMLVTGVISTRLGVKNTLLCGIIIIALFAALGGWSSGIWELVGLRGGWGLGNALFVATALSAIVSLSTAGTAQAIILYEAAIGIGISVGPLLGGELGSISWRGPFFGVSVLMVIAFLFLLFIMPRTKNVVKKKSSLLDPFRALKYRGLLTLGLTALLYNFGFFTLLAYSPFVMHLKERGLGYVFLGWGLLLAVTSVFVAPRLEKQFGTIKSMIAMLLLFAVTLLAMGIWTDAKGIVIAAVIIAGAFLGNNNTLITTAVMQSAPVERSTASAAYSFLRFLGGAAAPWMAGKLAEVFNPHVPFIVGGGFVLLSVLFIWINRKHLMHIDRAGSAH
ncbi:MFS transporter [Paenibacillus allorhizosphaerae]|uniref:Multidrug efflux protein YfmO n=1 Tax=Paenibacillus allorhizosphaerae TaxID=2849866 RepID=A0ABM8VKD1_9BACL|nr:MFS transporter [Paenibacillus allorhizosphaerae]CAG7646882.1 Multidrug efflux protein YfmO [Paenibacillus allorhizosphaerae]